MAYKVTSRWRVIAASVTFVAVLGLVSMGLGKIMSPPSKPVVVLRVDDIQDFAFREGQLFLLNESLINKLPLSLGVVAGMLGEDEQIVGFTKLAVKFGSEVAAHGWMHEDLAGLSFEEQNALLNMCKQRIKEVLDADTTILIPPMFGDSAATLAAMGNSGYDIISASTELSAPDLNSAVKSLPATVELSDYSQGTWNMKGLPQVKTEISSSIRYYGFAVVVTHPQEFMKGKDLNKDSVGILRELISYLKEKYSTGVLKDLVGIK